MVFSEFGASTALRLAGNRLASFAARRAGKGRSNDAGALACASGSNRGSLPKVASGAEFRKLGRPPGAQSRERIDGARLSKSEPCGLTHSRGNLMKTAL